MADLPTPATPQEPAPLLFVAQERVGVVRYARPPDAYRPTRLTNIFFLGLVLLLTAASAVLAILVRTAETALGWQLGLVALYLAQLLLNTVAEGRLWWRVARWSLGGLEVELTAAHLRSGGYWRGWWFDAKTIPLEGVKRLVIAIRPPEKIEGEHWRTWDLVVERFAGPPVTLVSAVAAPEIIRPLAADLHGRLAVRFGSWWPALVEEEWPVAEPRSSPPAPRWLPPGARSWMAVHLVGTVGLASLVALVGQQEQRPSWFGVALVGCVGLQGLILLINYFWLKMNKLREPD